MAGSKKGRAPANKSDNRWRRSPDIEESWDSEQEWEVGDIVDMYVDPMVPGKTMYKVTWPGWQRQDGSCTTWVSEEECMVEFPNIVNEWKAKHARGKASISKPVHPHSLFYYDMEETALGIKHTSTSASSSRSLQQNAGSGSARIQEIHTKSEDDELDIIMHDVSSSPPALSKHKRANNSTASTISKPKRRHSPSPASVSRSRHSSSSTATDMRATKRRYLPSLTVDPIPSTSTSHASPSSSRTLVPSPITDNLGTPGPVDIIHEWYDAIGEAAVITCPQKLMSKFLSDLPKGFKYLESKYLDEKDNDEKQGFFAACSCDTGCSDPTYCNCQADSSIFNDVGDKIIAYDRNRYQFSSAGSLVIECNEACACDNTTCMNRVAQRPRDIPMQIFMTRRCGWGVKTTVHLERGQFIGLYTGKLIERKLANKLDGPQQRYIFDLDFGEHQEDDDPDGISKYSVVSYHAGNWSRFLNHSCDPNVRVYPVLFDDPQVPKLAFVAAKDVLPFTELTIDYIDAAGARENERPPRKPKNAVKCACDADKCRGWYTQ